MVFQVTYTFRDSYIPPRCRKPRFREITNTAEVDILDVRREEAPIAFTYKNCLFPTRVTLRWYNGALYARAIENRAGSEKWETITGLQRRLRRLPIHCCIKESKEEGVAYARNEAARFIIINGREVWVKAGEPRYEIATFGLGGNHAETALMISTGYNSNVPVSRYFSALQRKEAIAEAIHVALARGDTNSVRGIKRAWKINVHIPEAVRCDPQKEAGSGDPFLNRLDALTTMKDPLTVGLLSIGLALKETER